MSRLSRVPVRITGCAPIAFATATPRRPIGPGPLTTTLSPATRPPSSVRPYIAVPAVTTKRRLLVRHRFGNGDHGVDVVDLVFAEAAVGGEAVGAVALVDVAVVEAVIVAGGVHALAAALALAAAGMDFDGDALADRKLVDAGSERDDRAHIFVAGREILVERLAAQDTAPASRGR